MTQETQTTRKQIYFRSAPCAGTTYQCTCNKVSRTPRIEQDILQLIPATQLIYRQFRRFTLTPKLRWSAFILVSQCIDCVRGGVCARVLLATRCTAPRDSHGEKHAGLYNVQQGPSILEAVRALICVHKIEANRKCKIVYIVQSITNIFEKSRAGQNFFF